MLNCAHIENDQKGVTTSRSSVTRYAIYFTPQPGTALAAFGRSWFGRANDGATLQAFSDSGFAGTGFAKVPSAPGRYTGLHALLKAPFALRDGTGVDALKSRLVSFATRRKPAETGPLTLAREGRFLVLRPVEPTPVLEWLAAQCVAAFEDFAAPPGDTERAAHASPNLSDYQRLLLESFGDPYVLSEYRFYITLTGPLDKTHLERVTQALWPVLEDICASGVTVDGLSLFGDCGGRSPMRLIGRYRLGA
ncbi:MAG: DUF1045 domain-containing protein [Methyloceanibacter sp.]